MFLWLLFVFFCSTRAAQQQDASVLLSFKRSLAMSETLSSWSSSNPHSSWAGVVWDLNTTTHVLELHLTNLSLAGELSPFWCRLPSLRFLDLSYNNLTGSPVSVWCSTLSTSLEIFNLSANSFTGQLPREMESTSLREFQLGSNHLTGSIPPSVGQLRSLETLALYDNQLTGQLPSNVSQLQRLTSLLIDGNMLTGSMPSLSNCTSLLDLQLAFNFFTGTLPDLPPTLFRLVATSNNFTSAFRDGFRGLPALEEIYLLSNGMSGPFPNIVNCSRLRIVNVANNHFSGSVPPELSALHRLESLYVSYNDLSGDFPPLPNCTALQFLSFAVNRITSLPQSFAGLTSVQTVNFNANRLSGNLPDWFGPNLVDLSVGGNNLSGAIPDSWAEFSASIRLLDLENNVLSGPIPTWLGNCSQLFALVLLNNSFTGSIPEELGNISSLQRSFNKTAGCSSCTGDVYQIGNSQVKSRGLQGIESVINLCNNRLTGSIPKQLGKLQSLQNLLLCNNSLTGPIPVSLSNSLGLESLQLQNNKLNGSIPVDLTKLNFLSAIDVSNNQLSGPIPTQAQFSTFSNPSWFQGNPGLCGSPLLVPCVTHNNQSDVVRDHHTSSMHLGLPIAVGAVLGLPIGFWVGIFWFPRTRVLVWFEFY